MVEWINGLSEHDLLVLIAGGQALILVMLMAIHNTLRSRVGHGLERTMEKIVSELEVYRLPSS